MGPKRRATTDEQRDRVEEIRELVAERFPGVNLEDIPRRGIRDHSTAENGDEEDSVGGD